MEAVKQLFWSSRPISWVNTAYPFALAYWFVTESIDLNLILGSIFFLIPYNLLMYGINDVFDYESDLRNPRKGSVEGALLDPQWHRLTIWTSLILVLPFALYFFLVGSVASSLWLVFILFTVLAYSVPKLRFKERPFIDSLTSASHFVGPMVFGLSLAGANVLETKVLSMILAFTLWGAASHAFGAVQDVRADREAGISSIATSIGARTTTRLAFVSYLLAGILVLNAGYPAVLAAVAAIPYLVIVSPYLQITDETCERANRGWKKFIWLNFFAGTVVTLLVIASKRFF